MSELSAKVEQLHISRERGIEAEPVESITVDLSGIVGDMHAGTNYTVEYPSRFDRSLGYVKGQELDHNPRQFYAISTSELKAIAESLGIDHVDPSWVRANLTLEASKNLADLPPGSKIEFPEGAVLLIEDINRPCTGPGKLTAKHNEGFNPSNFPKAAFSRFGVMGSIEEPGIIRLDDVAIIKVFDPKFFSLPPKI